MSDPDLPFIPYVPPNTGEEVHDPVPAYDIVDNLEADAAELGLPLTWYPAKPPHAGAEYWDDVQRRRAKIVDAFHDAVEKQQYDAITQFVARGIVSPDATRHDGPTPLQVAVVMGDAKLVLLLASLGADVNALHTVPTYFECAEAKQWARMPPTEGRRPDAFGVPRHPSYQCAGEEAPRTALMVAAARGNLAMTRLLLSLGADDGVTAPDGQIALRLAATNRHRDVVNLLPARRGGELLRFKTSNARALKGITKALQKCGMFIYMVGYVPFFIVIQLPVEWIAKPLWRNRMDIASRCARAVRAVPRRMFKIGVDIGHRLKGVPKAVVNGAVWVAVHAGGAVGEVAKVLWVGVKALPGALGELPMALARGVRAAALGIASSIAPIGRGLALVSKEMSDAAAYIAVKAWAMLRAVPGAVGIMAKWAWSTVTALTRALGEVPAAVVSALHTIGVAIASALSRVNLASVGRALAAVPKVLFVDLPVAIWGQLRALGKLSHDVLERLFGVLGQIVWGIGYAAQWLVLYIPKQLVKIVGKVGEALGNGFKEIVVWFDPKHIG
ncbi:uncharacterized protein LOC62_01G001687 [Vanrija pseudolonga]|uniref:Uncharacterized protein n=1 Tax=Vanrija pseudolonga TaxID=143232 RepID=A0AAF0Y5N2_9TREE|nr:hypothetical protein LOC62_01G001687 [Vanrija pseudolonga]